MVFLLQPSPPVIVLVAAETSVAGTVAGGLRTMSSLMCAPCIAAFPSCAVMYFCAVAFDVVGGTGVPRLLPWLTPRMDAILS